MHVPSVPFVLNNEDSIIYVVDPGRKRTLFHCKWANSISYISRMLY